MTTAMNYNEISRSAVPQEVLDNKSLYGFDYSDLVWDSSIIKFENSGYYEDHYESSGSSSSDYDSDYDWDSGDSWIQVAVTGIVTGDYCIT